MTTSAALFYDAGPPVGLGHLRRMEALVERLRGLGVDASVQPVGSPAKADIVVVDSYLARAGEDDRFDGRILVAVDDLGRDLPVDLLIDPNPGSDGVVRRASRRVLCGMKYALVDSALAGRQVRRVAERVDTVLVTTGAADAAGVGAAIAGELAHLLPATVRVELVVGPWSTKRVPDGVHAVVALDGLAAHLADADVVVTAAGVTLIEALVLGRPTIAVVTAANQERAGRGGADAGACLLTDATTAAAAAASLAGDPARRRHLAAQARTYADGQGAARVAEEIVALA